MVAEKALLFTLRGWSGPFGKQRSQNQGGFDTSVCIDVDLCDNILIGSPGRLQQPNISEDVLVTVQKNLYALKELLDRNPHLFHSAPGDHTGARSASASEQEAWKVRSLYL